MADTDNSSSTFTDEDAANLAALQLKQAQAAWQVAEGIRKANLAAITPAATALGTLDAINAMVNALKAARSAVDVDTAIRIGNITTVLSVDAVAILNTAQQLATPIPQPVSSAGTTGTASTSS